MIDDRDLDRQTGGDGALQLELLTLFLLQLRELAGRVERSGSGGADLTGLLHRVRGAASAVGAGQLALRLGRAESALAAGSSDPSALDGLRADVAAACHTLEGLIAARTGPGLAKAGESR